MLGLSFEIQRVIDRVVVGGGLRCEESGDLDAVNTVKAGAAGESSVTYRDVDARRRRRRNHCKYANWVYG